MFPNAVAGASLLALALAVPTAAQHAAPGTLFEQNLGAYDASAHFVARRDGVHAAALSDGLAVAVVGSDALASLRATFEGGTATTPVGVGRTPTVVNHLRGDPSAWTVGAATYERIAWRDVWPGVDVELYDGAGGLEYDLRLAPGADLSAVGIRWEGQTSLTLDVDGALVLDTPLGALSQSAPVVFQADGTPVDGRFVLRDAGVVGFEVGAHDASQPLIVDPILAFAGYAPVENVAAVAVASGPSPDVYLLGDTTLTDVPTTPGVVQPDNAGFRDAWLAQLDHSGNVVRWITYLGGDASNEFAVGLEVAPDGSLIAAVNTQGQGFPTTPGAHDATSDGRGAAIASLTPDGTTLNWSTYAITTGFATADVFDIHVTPDGAVLFAGQACDCSDFAETAGAAFPTSGIGSAFVGRLASDGSTLEAATWLSDVSGWTKAESVGVDSQGRIAVLGRTRVDVATTPNAFAPSRPGSEDFFVAVVSQDATTIDYLSYLGTPGNDTWEGAAMTVDAQDRVWAGWVTVDPGAPTTPDAWNPNWTTGVDLVVTAVDPNLSGPASLVFSSYIPGGNENERPEAAALRSDGSVVMLFGAGFFSADTALGSNVSFGTSVLLEIEPDATLRGTTEIGWAGGAGFGRPDLALTDDGSALVVSNRNPAGDPIAVGTAAGVASAQSTYVVKVALDDTWMDVGRGLAGTNGTPRLQGAGPLSASTVASLDVTGAPAGGLVLISAGPTFDDVPLQGGLLVALPTVVFPPYVASPLGEVSLDVDLGPAVLPGLTMYVQAWIVDAGGVQGYAATNALAATTN